MPTLYIINKALQVKQCGMTLVCMVKLGCDTELLKHQYTADAKKVFLLDTVLPVTAIELVGDRTVKLRIHVEVRIHKVEIHAPYIHAPDMAIYYTARIGHFQDYRIPILVTYLLDRELVEVLRLIVCNLLAINAQCLCKIAITVKETNSSHVNTAVRCLLYIVTGEYAQATGIYLKAVA